MNQDPLVRQVRILDKLVDELAKAREALKDGGHDLERFRSPVSN